MIFRQRHALRVLRGVCCCALLVPRLAFMGRPDATSQSCLAAALGESPDRAQLESLDRDIPRPRHVYQRT